MPKRGLTEILCVIDKSGSMGPLAQDVIGGFNRFLADQKACPALTLFDTRCSPAKSRAIGQVPDMDTRSYLPGGGTALLDAIGMTITEAGAEFDKRSEDQKPEKVVMLIMTDGQENSSIEYKKETIRQMIERQSRDWNWQFVFIGANQDAFAEAGGIGVTAGLTANMAPTAAGIESAYDGVSASLCAYRRDAGSKTMKLNSQDFK